MDMTQTLLNDTIIVPVSTATPAIFWGPSSIFGYTILQGFFTVLAIKEVISVTRNAVIGSSTDLCPNQSILYHMVEDWEDLGKQIRKLLWPKPLQTLRREGYVRAPLNRVGWARFLTAALIALWLFGIDMALITLSVPNRAPQEAQFMTRITWDNSAKIPKLKKHTVLQGSFSRAIKLESRDNDVEFTRLPSVSLERTDYRDFKDFNAVMPDYSGRLFVCNNTEGWRITCRVHCKKRLYQYKLRLDVATDTSTSSFFVPTVNFSVDKNGTNPISKYTEEMVEQLGINVSTEYANQTYFEIKAHKQPEEYTCLKPGTNCVSEEEKEKYEVLTHDAIATLFFRSISIREAPKNAIYYERRAGERKEREGKDPVGVIAISQRPYLPLLGTIMFYLLMQIVSIIQLKAWKLRTHSNSLTALVEHCGGNVRENVANVVLEDRSLIESTLWSGKKACFEHVGYLPANIIMMVEEFVKETERYRKEHGGGKDQG